MKNNKLQDVIVDALMGNPINITAESITESSQKYFAAVKDHVATDFTKEDLDKLDPKTVKYIEGLKNIEMSLCELHSLVSLRGMKYFDDMIKYKLKSEVRTLVIIVTWIFVIAYQYFSR